MALMTRIVVVASLVSGAIAVMLGTTFYVFQEIVAGLLSIHREHHGASSSSASESNQKIRSKLETRG